MPIGLGTAVAAGAAVLGAGATIYASNKASKAQTQAANQASGIELQVADENNQLARDMYGANASRLDPYSNMGLAAGGAYMDILGVPYTHTPAPTPLPTGGSSGGPAGSGNAAIPGSIAAMESDGIPGNYQSSMTQYYLTHPPTPAEIAAMQNDGIAGNYAAAQAAAAALGSSPPTMAQINAMKNDGIAHNYASALAAYNAPPPAPASAPATNALAPAVQQQAQQAIAAGADPAAVAARAAQYGVHL